MNELEKRKLKYDIVFYHMEGCYYCKMSNDAIYPQIQSGIIGKFAHTDQPPAGVQGFPYFVNNKNGKTVAGWPSSKQALYDELEYTEPILKEQYIETPSPSPSPSPYTVCNNVCYENTKKAGFKENTVAFTSQWYSCMSKNRCFDLFDTLMQTPTQTPTPTQTQTQSAKREGFSENFEMDFSSFPVVENMETIPTDVLYHNHKGGYSKLSNCWVKQPDYTA